VNQNRSTTRKELIREWVHGMHLEFLRGPIMIPVWWAGMKLCDLLWALR
jgi:hypothetical protein